MNIAFDMTPRQTSRFFEQALRSNAELELETRATGQVCEFPGKLDGREGSLLRVRVESLPPSGLPLSMIGAFCDVRVQVDGQLYLFSAGVMDVLDGGLPVYLMLGTPETIQVANRRRFQRRAIPVAAQVRIAVAGQQPAHVALLADVSVEGMSCSLPNPESDLHLSIGDSALLSFELPGFDRRFELPAVICNKSVTPDKQLMTLGFEFAVSEKDPTVQQTYQKYCVAFHEMMSSALNTDGNS